MWSYSGFLQVKHLINITNDIQLTKIKSINNSMNQIFNIYHKPRYSSTEFYQYSTFSSIFNMYQVYQAFLSSYISNHIQQTILLNFTYLKDDSIQFELNQKKFARSSQITFWFLIETNNNQTFFLMYEQYPRTCDAHLTSTPYLSSW